MSFLRWIVKGFSRPPDFVIGGQDSPYMLRWWVIPRNRWFNIYLHQVLRSDDDRALHDHPWRNVSVVLKGAYTEIVPDLRAARTPHTRIAELPTLSYVRGRGSFVFRRATSSHRLVIGDLATPVWTLFITGRRIREWGFHCPNGWRPWFEFVHPEDAGSIGPGCD